jgi:hypothetical protein
MKLPMKILQDAILCADDILKDIIRRYINTSNNVKVVNKLKRAMEVIDRKETFIKEVDNNSSNTIKSIHLLELLNKDVPLELLTVWQGIISYYEESLKDNEFKAAFDTKQAIRSSLFKAINREYNSEFNKDNPELLSALLTLKELLTNDAKFKNAPKTETRRYSGTDRFRMSNKDMEILKYAIQFRVGMSQEGMIKDSWRVL